MLEQARQQALVTEATTSVDTGDAPIIEDGSDVESGSDAGNDHAALDGVVMHLMTAAGASAPADAVFRFTAGDAMQTEDDDEDADRSEDYSDDGRASDL